MWMLQWPLHPGFAAAQPCRLDDDVPVAKRLLLRQKDPRKRPSPQDVDQLEAEPDLADGRPARLGGAQSLPFGDMVDEAVNLQQAAERRPGGRKLPHKLLGIDLLAAVPALAVLLIREVDDDRLEPDERGMFGQQGLRVERTRGLPAVDQL